MKKFLLAFLVYLASIPCFAAPTINEFVASPTGQDLLCGWDDSAGDSKCFKLDGTTISITGDTISASGGGGSGISDGDYGDITISGSGTVLTIDNDVVTNAKAANMAQSTIKGRAASAGTGDPTDLTAAQVKTILALASGDISDFIEAAQDAVGSIFADTSTIDFTYTDGTPDIAAIVVANSITATQLSNSINISEFVNDSGYALSGANTDITSVLLSQTGLVVKGGSANALTIKPNETLSAARTLNLIVNDASRTIDLGGNLTVSSAATISGTNTGDQTDVTGNAGTVTFADAGGDTTTFCALGTAATGNLSPATDAECTYNATTNALTTTTFIGALTGNASTATALQNARTIGGVSFDGTANITVATATGGFTVSGGNLALGTNSLTLTGSIASTGSRVTKGWFTDLEVTNAIVGSITGNAATATALAANGTNCSAGNYPLGVDASGNAESCTAAATGTVTSVSGTANRITSTGGATPVIDISATFEALLGKVATGLQQFASTTSAQFAGVISDETGTGKVTLATSPLFTTSILPATNDGATIGAASTGEWSDVFLAEGGVINWDNGDATMTHTGNDITFAGISTFGLGTSTATTLGTIELGAASDTTLARSAAGAVTVEGVAVATATNTVTFTNKRITPREGTEASSSASAINSDLYDIWTITALAAADTIAAPSGTPTQGQLLEIRIKDNGTARALSWNAIFRAGTDVALPTTTTISKTLYTLFQYNSTDSKWDLLAKADGF